MASPRSKPGPKTSTSLPAAVVAAVQTPFPLSFIQVIFWGWPWAIAKVEARHSIAMAPPNVFPTVRNIMCFSLFAVGCTGAARDWCIPEDNLMLPFLERPSERNNYTYEKFKHQSYVRLR
jgi:hypothetical protein